MNKEDIKSSYQAIDEEVEREFNEFDELFERVLLVAKCSRTTHTNPREFKLNNVNYLKIPRYFIYASEGSEGEKLFNELYKKMYNSSIFHPIKRTRSGGISLINWHGATFDVRPKLSCIEITIATRRWGCFRLMYSINKSSDNHVSGSKALKEFTKQLKDDGIDIEDYAINDEIKGKEINDTIHKYDINCFIDNCELMTKINNVHHLDFHSFFMMGMMRKHPEMEETIKRLYKQRKEDSTIKSIFTHSIGKMHSIDIAYKYVNLSKDAIDGAYELFDKVKEDLVKSGRRLLLTNTDGIWYQGDIYSGEYESETIGGWSNDHTNCTIMIRSKGAYMYEEDNKRHAVVRGATPLDKIKSRDEWTWRDLEKEVSLGRVWQFEEGEGIVWHNVD